MSPTSEIDAALLLKEARERGRLSQRALAERAGTSQSVVARIELGETSPTIGTLNRLLRASGLHAVVTLRPGRHQRSGASDDQLDDQLIERLRQFFATQPVRGVAAVYLFGSTARRTRHRESDLDLAILVDRSEYPSRAERGELRVRLAAEIASVSGVSEVDLLILNDLPPVFARTIVLGGIRLLQSDPGIDHAFARDVQLRAADIEPFLARMRKIKLERLRA